MNEEHRPPSSQETPLIKHVADLDENVVLSIVRRRLDQGGDPLGLIYECEQGMRVVGKRYEEGEYYIAALIMAGEIFRQVVELVEPRLTMQVGDESSGRVVLGTVQGDIHDIGKSVLAMLLSCHGFTVRDLGVDVRPDRFVDAAREYEPHIIGLSGLLTSAYDSMRKTVAVLREATDDWDTRPDIIIGGGQIDGEICRYVGADYWRGDVMDSVHLCQRLMAARDATSDEETVTAT